MSNPMNDPVNPTSPPSFDDVRAADPVRLADLPSASSPEAQALLTATTTKPSTLKRQGGSRLPMLGAVAAAVAIIAASFAILAPSNTPDALASVKAAAQQSAEVNSGRILTSFAIDGTIDGETDSAAGTVELLFNGDDLAISLDLDQLPEAVQDDEADLEAVESRVVDGVVYIKGGFGDEWVGLELPQFAIDEITKADPRTLLQTIQSLVEAEEVGPGTVDGVDVTLYSSTVDLADPNLSSSGWLGALDQQLEIEADGTVTIETAIDNDGQMRRVVVSGEVSDPQEGEGSAAFSLSTVFTDLNNVDRIVAPEGVVPNGLLDGLVEED